GKYFDYEEVSPDAPETRDLFEWRETFHLLCERHKITPAVACIQFALSPPGVLAVSLNTSDPQRIAQNVEAVEATVPPEFWQEARQQKLIDADYPHLPRL